MAHVSDIKIFSVGNSQQMMYNKKLCFEAEIQQKAFSLS